MHRIYTATEVTRGLADAIRQAESGDLVWITRYRKPVAALVGGDRLEGLEAAADGGEATTGTAATGPAGEATPRELWQRAAAVALRRIEADLAKLPERLKPAMRLLRANLFHPRTSVERIKAALGVAAHDFTSEFGRALGVTLHRYLTDRRLETAERLLVDTELKVRAIARLVGYSGSEALSRAFKKRHGVRPPIYREFSGKLSLAVAGDAGADSPPILPRYLAGVGEVEAGALCARCGRPLVARAAPRVYEDLAAICDLCARRRAPEIAAMLAGRGAG